MTINGMDLFFLSSSFLKQASAHLSDPEIPSEFEKVISEDMEIDETFNEFFVNIVTSLKISLKENYETNVENDKEPILN